MSGKAIKPKGEVTRDTKVSIDDGAKEFAYHCNQFYSSTSLKANLYPVFVGKDRMIENLIKRILMVLSNKMQKCYLENQHILQFESHKVVSTVCTLDSKSVDTGFSKFSPPVKLEEYVLHVLTGFRPKHKVAHNSPCITNNVSEFTDAIDLPTKATCPLPCTIAKHNVNVGEEGPCLKQQTTTEEVFFVESDSDYYSEPMWSDSISESPTTTNDLDTASSEFDGAEDFFQLSYSDQSEESENQNMIPNISVREDCQIESYSDEACQEYVPCHFHKSKQKLQEGLIFMFFNIIVQILTIFATGEEVQDEEDYLAINLKMESTECSIDNNFIMVESPAQATDENPQSGPSKTQHEIKCHSPVSTRKFLSQGVTKHCKPAVMHTQGTHKLVSYRCMHASESIDCDTNSKAVTMAVCSLPPKRKTSMYIERSLVPPRKKASTLNARPLAIKVGICCKKHVSKCVPSLSNFLKVKNSVSVKVKVNKTKYPVQIQVLHQQGRRHVRDPYHVKKRKPIKLKHQQSLRYSTNPSKYNKALMGHSPKVRITVDDFSRSDLIFRKKGSVSLIFRKNFCSLKQALYHVPGLPRALTVMSSDEINIVSLSNSSLCSHLSLSADEHSKNQTENETISQLSCDSGLSLKRCMHNSSTDEQKELISSPCREQKLALLSSLHAQDCPKITVAPIRDRSEDHFPVSSPFVAGLTSLKLGTGSNYCEAEQHFQRVLVQADYANRHKVYFASPEASDGNIQASSYLPCQTPMNKKSMSLPNQCNTEVFATKTCRQLSKLKIAIETTLRHPVSIGGPHLTTKLMPQEDLFLLCHMHVVLFLTLLNGELDDEDYSAINLKVGFTEYFVDMAKQAAQATHQGHQHANLQVLATADTDHDQHAVGSGLLVPAVGVDLKNLHLPEIHALSTHKKIIDCVHSEHPLKPDLYTKPVSLKILSHLPNKKPRSSFVQVRLCCKKHVSKLFPALTSFFKTKSRNSVFIKLKVRDVECIMKVFFCQHGVKKKTKPMDNKQSKKLLTSIKNAHKLIYKKSVSKTVKSCKRGASTYHVRDTSQALKKSILNRPGSGKQIRKVLNPLNHSPKVTIAVDNGSTSELSFSRKASVSLVFRDKFCCLKHASYRVPGLQTTLTVMSSDERCSNIINLSSSNESSNRLSRYETEGARHQNYDEGLSEPSPDSEHVSEHLPLVRSSEPLHPLTGSPEPQPPGNIDLNPIPDLLHAQDYQTIILIIDEDMVKQQPHFKVVALYFVKGLSYLKLGNHSMAKVYFKRCESIALDLNSHGDIALCNTYLGDIEFTAQAYLNAGQYYRKAISHYSPECVAIQFKMVPPSLSLLHSKLGSSLRSASKSVEAIQEYRNAIQESLTGKDRLAAHTSLGNLYQSLGDNSNALKEYEQSVTLAESIGDFISLGWAHGNMGNAYLGLYQKDKALYHLTISLDLAVEHEPTPQAIGRTYNNLGTAYQSLNDLDKAQEYYDLALSQAIYGSDIPGQARVYGNIGNVLMLQKNFERAIPHFTEVLQLSQDRSTISTAHHNRGCANYEWAESKMDSLYSERTQLAKSNTESLHPQQTHPDSKVESLCSEFRGRPSQTCYHDRIESKMDYLAPEQTQNTADGEMNLTDPKKFYLHGPNVADASESSRPLIVPDSILKYYRSGSEDLEEVVKYHEDSLESIKGSSKGLTLSVSLFESNSRTFHRLQDCLVMQGKWDRALLVAEQSRARTLGELMLKKKASEIQYTQPLTSPLSLEQMASIASLQNCPLVYLSYTGARLLGWVIVPHSGDMSMNMFEVPLEDTMFDGKSFDYHVRYNLTETLVERSFEMYRSVEYDEKSSAPVHNLYKIVAKPILKILEEFPSNSKQPEKIIIIPDSYTSLVPFSCLRDPESGKFLGDKFYFQMMPSLLSMGVLTQLPEVTVTIPADPHNFCIVGNPYIPPFLYDGQRWDLGKLPYAQREAEWVAHVLKTTPIVKQQATRSAVLMRIMNARVIHLATHGSASAGFLAFASITHCREGKGPGDGQVVNSAAVLLNPEDIEKLNISPALVVLSSCDSGRGTVKADGVQGMARAFILAGAQSVLTTLWRVPDESASVFMKFFYQYLMDGLKSSFALQKAILSLRCFAKYSQYVHWSGYQLTGRDIQFETTTTPNDKMLQETLGQRCVFPRLKAVKALQSALVDSPRIPTDVQIVRGSPGIRPSEVVKDFIHSFHKHFTGGIFWINCRYPDFVDASVEYIEKTTGTELDNIVVKECEQVLLVFDAITQVPTSEKLLRLMKNRYVHMVFNYKSYVNPDKLIKEVDRKLIRGCVIHDIEPLSMIDSTQRMVHSLLKEHHLAPNNEDQTIFENLAQFTSGSPVLVEIASKALLSLFKDSEDDPHKTLESFADDISLKVNRKERRTSPQLHHKTAVQVRSMSEVVKQALPAVLDVPSEFHDIWETNTKYDSWDSIEELLNSCKLSPEERLLLNCLSIFGCSPIPSSLVTELSSLIATAAQKPHLAGVLSAKLLEMNLMKKYPSPVVLHPSLKQDTSKPEFDFIYVPQYISRSIWKNIQDVDHIMALTTTYHALLAIFQIATPLDSQFLLGLCYFLLENYEVHFELLGKECYKSVYSLYLEYRLRYDSSSILQSGFDKGRVTSDNDDKGRHVTSGFVRKEPTGGGPPKTATTRSAKSSNSSYHSYELTNPESNNLSHDVTPTTIHSPQTLIYGHNHVDSLTADSLQVIKNHIWQARVKWFNMGLQLGIEVDVLHDIETTHDHQEEECFTEMLTQWLAMVHPKPSLKHLIKALKSTSVSLPELAERMEHYSIGKCGCFK